MNLQSLSPPQKATALGEAVCLWFCRWRSVTEVNDSSLLRRKLPGVGWSSGGCNLVGLFWPIYLLLIPCCSQSNPRVMMGDLCHCDWGCVDVLVVLLCWIFSEINCPSWLCSSKAWQNNFLFVFQFVLSLHWTMHVILSLPVTFTASILEINFVQVLVTCVSSCICRPLSVFRGHSSQEQTVEAAEWSAECLCLGELAKRSVNRWWWLGERAKWFWIHSGDGCCSRGTAGWWLCLLVASMIVVLHSSLHFFVLFWVVFFLKRSDPDFWTGTGGNQTWLGLLSHFTVVWGLFSMVNVENP